VVGGSRDRDVTAPTITVVIPTHRRPQSLNSALRGLAAQADPGVAWDVVVVESDSLPGTVATSARSALDALPVPSSVVVEPTLGASNARNRGVAEASGTIVAFLDDDVVPEADWLAQIVEPLLAGRADATGGRVVLDPAVPRPRWLTPWLAAYLSEFDPAPDEVDLRTIPTRVLSEPYMLTANAAFTTDALADAGGFDATLGTRAGVPFGNEELRLCRQLVAAERRIRYVPAARVVHELPAARLRRSYLARRLYAQGRSDWMLDGDVLAASRSAGVRRALELFGSDLRVARGHERPVRPGAWLTWSFVRRAGFLREASACLVGRRR